LLSDHPFAQLWQQDIPVRIASVELTKFILNAYVGRVCDERSISQVRTFSSKTASKLERNRQRLTNIVESRDLEFRQVETFTQHVYANHNSRLAADDLLPNRLPRSDGFYARMQLHGVEFGVLAVDLIYRPGSGSILDARHEDVAFILVLT
jgi:hypothetical protein